MKRSELKPGTIFKYTFPKGTGGSIYYVPPMDNPPSFAIKSEACPGFSWDADVFLYNSVSTVDRPPPQDVTKLEHYTTGGIEAIDAIEAWGLDFYLANAVKYIARAGKKPGCDIKTDLLKARAYLTRKINALDGVKSWGIRDAS